MQTQTAQTVAVMELRGIDLPPVEQTLPVAELIHRALIRVAAKGDRIDCPELTGQNAWGHPLVGSHLHLHVLPVDGDDDGLLDHVVLCVPMGISSLCRQAIGSIKNLFDARGKPWLQIAASRQTRLTRLLQLPEQFQQLRLKHEPSVWRSVTPFIPSRYLKPRGTNSLIGQIERELQNRNFPAAEIEILQAETLAMRRFVRRRQLDRSQPPQDAGFAIQLTFSQPTCGPIALGCASHFGMGLFCRVGIAHQSLPRRSLVGNAHST